MSVSFALLLTRIQLLQYQGTKPILQVRPGVATSLSLDDTPQYQLVVTPEVHDIQVVETRVYQLVER